MQKKINILNFKYNMPTSSRKSLLRQFKFIKVGGDCTPAQLIDPSAVCPISQELLSELNPKIEYQLTKLAMTLELCVIG